MLKSAIYLLTILPNISHLNDSVSPGNRAHSNHVATISLDPATLSDIAHLDGSFLRSSLFEGSLGLQRKGGKVRIQILLL
jgi:hypothetical protein